MRSLTCGTLQRPLLRGVLEAEGEVWKERLHWDYRASAKLLMQYLDSHMLPGYVALEAGQVTGYVFCVYEETKGGHRRRIRSAGIGFGIAITARMRRARWRRRCCGTFSRRC